MLARHRSASARDEERPLLEALQASGCAANSIWDLVARVRAGTLPAETLSGLVSLLLEHLRCQSYSFSIREGLVRALLHPSACSGLPALLEAYRTTAAGPDQLQSHARTAYERGLNAWSTLRVCRATVDQGLGRLLSRARRSGRVPRRVAAEEDLADVIVLLHDRRLPCRDALGAALRDRARRLEDASGTLEEALARYERGDPGGVT